MRTIFVSEYIMPFNGCKILDIGCGPGTIVPYLGNVEYLGIDNNPLYIDKANKKFANACINFECGDVTSASKKKSGYYDRVIMSGVLHHISDKEAIECIKAAKCLLKPEGRFCSIDGTYTPETGAIGKLILSKDRGKHVRKPPEYSNLIKPYFPNALSVIRKDIMNLPVSYIVFY